MADSVRWLRIDFEKCIKAGECYYNHPELFMRTDSAYPALRIRRAATPAQFREAREAMEVCPSRAISYEDDSAD